MTAGESKHQDTAGRCLVTGCAGFVGSHLTQALLEKGLRVTGVDNFFSGHARNMAGFAAHPGFVFHECSITDEAAMRRVFAEQGPLTAIFHLAAVVSVPWSVANPEITMAVNYQATARLLELSGEMGGGRFVFAGSAAEYGDTRVLPTPEDAAGPDTVQLSPYGRAKYLSSVLVGSSGRGASLRCFNIFGPRQDPSSPYSGVISRFCLQAISGEPMTVFGDGSQTRDFIYVADVVEAYLLAAGLSSGQRQGLDGIFNVGRGEPVSVLELARLIAGAAKISPDIVFGPPRAGDIVHSLAGVGKLTAQGFSPKVTVADGLARTLAWMGEQAQA